VTSRLSVLTTCHNDGATLEHSVRSLLDSAGVELEVLVLNNASTDETEAVLTRLEAEDHRVRGFHQRAETPWPHPTAINFLASLARGEWILVHNADDWADAGYVQAILDAADQHPEVNCIFSPWQWEGARHEVQVFPAYDPATMIAVHQIPGLRAVRIDLWKRTGGEDPRFPVGADWEWAVRASLAGLKPLQLDHPYLHVRDQGAGRLSHGWLAVRDTVRAHMRRQQELATC
jgi:glycosyltransferase involved in cell wall biosynthesis